MALNTIGLALNIVKTNAELDAEISTWRTDNQIIGFVPTMGALHAGHLHLLDVAKEHSTKTVCSIFVNPTQFNEKADFERYPRTIDNDIDKLKGTSCNLVYTPTVEDVYDPKVIITNQFDFGELENVMEGRHRPGHFNGVGTVVKRLFELVKPTKAFFGLKDYQQYCIIKKMVQIYNLPVEIIGVPTVREKDGLAMSSRNTLLDPLHRELAPVIYAAMLDARKNYTQLPINNIKLLVEQRLLAIPDVKLDYVEIADEVNLQPISDLTKEVKARIFVAAFFGKIRLIDNLDLN